MSTKNNKPLWKHIGIQEQGDSPESSIRSNHRPLKGFQINFQQGIDSNSQEEYKHRLHIRQVQSLPENISLKQESHYERTPMIITMTEDKKCEDEEIIQAISFQSQNQRKMIDMNHILESMKEIDYEHKKQQLPQQNNFILKNLQKNKNKQDTVVANQKLLKIQKNVGALKKQFNNYKLYLINIMSEWEVEAITNCKIMNQIIDKNIEDLVYSNKKMKESGRKTTEQHNLRNSRYEQELDQLRRSLHFQKQKCERYKTQAEEMQKKLRVIQSNKQSGINKRLHHSNISLEQVYLQKLKLLEKEITQNHTQKNSLISKMNTFKQMLLHKQNDLVRQFEENGQIQKRIIQLKNNLQDSAIRQRRLQSQLKIQQQKHQQQNINSQRQINKIKQQSSKLRLLLKNSQEQLNQCDSFITSANQKSKLQDEQIQKLKNHIRQTEIQYYKKLQHFDKILIEIQGNIADIMRSHQQKLQQNKIKQAILEKMKETLQYQQLQLRQKEYQMQQATKQLKNQLYMLERKEEGMRAEYKMAIQVQNATKDKWYQRYYHLQPQKQERIKYNNNSPVLTRDTASLHYNSRPSFSKKDWTQLPVRQRQPSKRKDTDLLYKAKSEKNFSVYTPTRDININTKRAQEKQQTYRDYNIGNRIDSLRKQLSKQLNLVNPH